MKNQALAALRRHPGRGFAEFHRSRDRPASAGKAPALIRRGGHRFAKRRSDGVPHRHMAVLEGEKAAAALPEIKAKLAKLREGR